MNSRSIVLVACLTVSTTVLADCPFLPESRMDKLFPDQAPWSTLDARQGRCKFLTDQSRAPIGSLAVNQIVEVSPKEAEDYVRSLGKGMTEGGYRVESVPALGAAGIAVRPGKASENGMLTLAGHSKNIVVMTNITFGHGVDAATQAKAVDLTREMFAADTGGGLVLPKVKPPTAEEKRAQEEEDRAAKAEAERAAKRLAAFTDAGGGVLLDKVTGLQWTQADNGKDIAQAQAVAYCEHLDLQGGHWRLPSEDELLALYVETDDDTVSCGDHQCYASKLFRLTNNYFWSATSESPTKFFHMELDDGPGNDHRVALHPGNSRNHRALCARHP